MLIAEMAADYAKQGLTLYGAMERLYETYGAYAERTMNLKFPGVDGLEAMKRLMSRLRGESLPEIGGTKVCAVRDYQSGIRKTADGQAESMKLAGSNVLYFELADGCVLIVRPSGTEPKIKIYILTKAATRAEAAGLVEHYAAAAEALAE